MNAKGGVRFFKRRVLNGTMLILSTASALFGLFWLGWILKVLVIRGLPAINWAFFTQLPAPPGEVGGGLSSAIVGTLMLTLLATAVGVPFGILAGTYLAEYGRASKVASLVRFVSDVLTSAPSIVIGVFLYAILVKPMQSFSGLAGGLALALIMIPMVTLTTEEMLALVPDGLREAALALGAPYWKVILRICYKRAMGGMTTGILLAVARVSGETAPLLFTSLNNPFWNMNPLKPTGTLTVTLFNYAMSPFEDWRSLAWGAALLITMAVLLTTVVSRLLVARKMA